ncbi:MAG: cobalamin B12-binding domain-containing protein [Chloroflexi bacterium]|nr:cobalamin B12-binding domain-containing protein [Chloroflexota bacterium]
MTDTREQLINLLADLEEDEVLQLVHQRVAAGDDPLQIIEDCNEGMRLVGERYERGDFYVSGLIMSGEIFREVVEYVQPMIERQTNGQSSGRVLVGTVSGDIHDIGKNMVGMLLACHGFDVIDLGVDVPPAEFAAKTLEIKPDIVGLSGLITSSFESMRATVTVLRAEADQHQLAFPIVIGGGMIDEQVCRFVGADYWVNDAMSGVRLCQRLMAGSVPP